MRPPAQPLFLARRSYRRRRLIDAIRLVPVLGAVLFMLPVLGSAGHVGATFRGGLYLFASWAFLIVLTAFLTRRLERAARAEQAEQAEHARAVAAPDAVDGPG